MPIDTGGAPAVAPSPAAAPAPIGTVSNKVGDVYGVGSVANALAAYLGATGRQDLNQTAITAANQAVRAMNPTPTPVPTPPPSGGGGATGVGGAGGSAPAANVSDTAANWSSAFTAQNAPSWWSGFIPNSTILASDPNTGYAALMNSLIPSLSPEDQRSVASNLAQMFPTVFSDYNPTNWSAKDHPIPTTMSEDLAAQYTGADRGQNTLQSMTDLMQKMGMTPDEMGPGYTYLQQVAKVLQDFGGTPGSPQTREQYVQMMAALDPLLAQSSGSASTNALGAYGPIAKMLAQPFFSAGPVTPSTTNASTGQTLFGAPNPTFM